MADALGFADADALMLAVSTAGRQIAWVSDDVWRRRRLWDPTPPPKRRFRRGTTDHGTLPAPADLGPDMVEIDGEIALTPLAPVSDDASLPLRLAATAAELDRPGRQGFAAPARRPHAAAGRPVGGPRPELRSSPCSGLGRPAVDKIESLDQHGLLVRLIPEWAAVRNKPQRNAYHTYTVDRHLLEAAALAAELTDTVERPDLLLVGTLLHDIGKGYPGDHTTVGMEVVERIATRMGFSPADVAVLVELVRHHLLLPDTATRRDLDDPTTIARVAQAAGNRLTLHLLAALTEADSRATGPSAWGAWKAGLVADLVERTDRVLQGRDRAGRAGPHRGGQPGADGGGARHGAPVGVAPTTPRHRGRAGPARPLLVGGRGPRPQRHGRARRQRQRRGRGRRRGLHRRGGPGNLARHGQAARGPGRRARPTAWPSASGSLSESAPTHSAGAPPRTSRASTSASTTRPPRRPPCSRCVPPTRIGLLHRITRALFEADLDVVSARVSTLGDMVVDAFYVRESGGSKVTDDSRLIRNLRRDQGRIGSVVPAFLAL